MPDGELVDWESEALNLRANLDIAITANRERDDIIRELYRFMIEELDPDPEPVGSYIVDLHLAAVADTIVGAANQPDPSPPEDE